MKIPFISFLMMISVLASSRAVALPTQNPKKILIWGVPSETVTKEYKTVPVTIQSNTMISFISSKLPEYQHESFSGNVSRILNQLRKNENTCFATSLEDRSRLKYTYWTPYGIIPPPVLIFRKDTLAKLKLTNGKLSLSKIFEDKNLKGIAGYDRFFGPDVDDILKKQATTNIQRTSFDYYSQSVFEMISKKRADFTVEHLFVFSQYQDRFKDLVFVPIVEAKKPLTIFVACSRTEFGKSVVEKVDHIVRENIQSPEYLQKALKMSTALAGHDFLVELDKYRKERSKKTLLE